jgi:uncharacterized protein (TIGR02594 family)
VAAVTPLSITPFHLAQRYVGVEELDAGKHHPLVIWWLSLCGLGGADFSGLTDEIPWCSAFVNGIAWELRLARSKSAAARSWLKVGSSVSLSEAEAGFDVVILKRGGGEQPGPEVLNAQGHVGFFAGAEVGNVLVLGGNQSDSVSVAPFPASRILGIRRLSL